MNPDSDDEHRRADHLSALCDGEATPEATAALLQQWAEDAAVRRRWHAYSLVGDVMRSGDLASCAEHDAAFVDRWRARMASEGLLDATGPASASTSATRSVAVASDHSLATGPGGTAIATPQETTAAKVIDLAEARGRFQRRLRRWSAPLGIAAGIMLVASVVFVSHTPEGGEGDPVALAAQDGAVRVLDRAARRDPRFDPYLAAHKQFQPVTAFGSNAGPLRSAAYEVAPER
jgi:sigma-E factor negative regulatory protein RseA